MYKFALVGSLLVVAAAFAAETPAASSAPVASGDIQEAQSVPTLLALMPTEGALGSADISPVAVKTTAPETLSAEELFSRAQSNYNAHNYTAAAEFFRQAADAGHAEAQYMYALMLYRGEGVQQPDATTSAHYYTLSAQQGFSKAQYNLAVLYYQGEGVTRDDAASYKWLYLASAQNEPRALKMLPVAERNLTLAQKTQALSDVAALTPTQKAQ